MATNPSASRRPTDSAFKQQRLPAWQPILTPKWVISSFMTIGVVFIAIAIAVLQASNGVLEISVEYSDACKDKLETWDATDKSVRCYVEFETTDDSGWETKDVYVYYHLDNFYQNHRKYVQSKSPYQLAGRDLGGLDSDAADLITKDKSLGDCTKSAPNSAFDDPSDGSKVYMYPCGLIAQSRFNDTLLVRDKTGKYLMWNPGNTDCSMSATKPCPTNPDDIAWPSDTSKKFKSPNVQWITKNCKYLGGQDFETSGWIHPDIQKIEYTPAGNCGAQVCGRRIYENGSPNKGIYNCWHNVSDQDFIVWMRVAALPSFKKLYRKIPAGSLKKSTKYELEVHNRFPVHSFKGSKKLVLSTTSWIGGKNAFLGYAYVVVGAICVALALAFLAKQLISPRKMGDARYLTFK